MADDEPDGKTNEILEAAKEAKARKARVKSTDRKGVPLTAIGIGLGIGSAAIAAAMLYSSRDKKD